MKFVIAALLVSCAAVAGAESVDIGSVRQNLFATCFATDQEGWMVGELGRIFRTTDGGATWTQQDAHTKRPFLAMSCLDPKTAWVAGKEGIVYGTKDGGVTWTQLQTGSQRHVFALEFPTAQRGHGAGDFGTMIHTEDGGATWTASRISEDVKLPESALDTGVEPGDVNLYGISFGDPDHVWQVGEFGVVLASQDGGHTWRQQTTPVESTLFGVRFSDAQHGIAVGVDSVILRTADGGATWAPVRAPVEGRSLFDVFVRGQQGWIVGDQGTVFKSADAGATWTVEPLPLQLAANWIRSVWLASGGRGLAVGSEGLVFRVDGSRVTQLGSRAVTPTRTTS
jgi:photosystem II stability/assembly factor-like uncharacterized protein